MKGLSYIFLALALGLQFLIVTSSPASAQSCECKEEKESVKEAADNATAIFTGFVKSIKDDPIRTKFKKIEFKVERKIKGLEHTESTPS